MVGSHEKKCMQEGKAKVETRVENKKLFQTKFLPVNQC